jgi:hypothetical protein
VTGSALDMAMVGALIVFEMVVFELGDEVVEEHGFFFLNKTKHFSLIDMDNFYLLKLNSS